VAVLNLFRLSHKRYDFRKQVVEHKIRFFIFLHIHILKLNSARCHKCIFVFM